MLTKYLNHPGSMVESTGEKTPHNDTKEPNFNCKHHKTRHVAQPKIKNGANNSGEKKVLHWNDRITIEGGVSRSPSPSPSPSLSWMHMDEYSPLIEPIPSKSTLEIQIEFKQNRENYIAQMVDEMFDADEESDISIAHPSNPALNIDIVHECSIAPVKPDINSSMADECEALKEKLKQMNAKYNDALKENETLRNDIERISTKRKESERLWMKQLEVLMDDNSELNTTIDRMTDEINKYQTALNMIHHEVRKTHPKKQPNSNAPMEREEKKEEEEETDDDETDIESDAGSWSTNVSVIIHNVDDESADAEDDGHSVVSSTSSGLSEVFSDVFPEPLGLYQAMSDDEDTNDRMMERECLMEFDIGRDASYQLLNECQSIYINTNQLTSKLIPQLIESCTRSIVGFYEMKHIFANFMRKYEEILQRFEEIQFSVLSTRYSLHYRYHQYDAIYKLLLKNVITARFDTEFVTKMYDKPFETRSKAMEELECEKTDPYTEFNEVAYIKELAYIEELTLCNPDYM